MINEYSRLEPAKERNIHTLGRLRRHRQAFLQSDIEVAGLERREHGGVEVNFTKVV